MNNKTFYEILGVSKDASPEEISAAKNKLAKKYHPDVNMKNGIDTTEIMQSILEAYHTLSDPEKRREYDDELNGSSSFMQTFDLHNIKDEPKTEDAGFIICWRAAGKLFDIITECEPLFKQKSEAEYLASLAKSAIKPILTLKKCQIPEKYWHPDIMNWLLFASYKNRNATIANLLSEYDAHMKADSSAVHRLKQQKKNKEYIRSIKKLLKY